MRASAAAVCAGAALAWSALSACSTDAGVGGSAAGSDRPGVVDVTADNDTCTVSDTTLAAGLHTFRVTNAGSDVTEFYVYADGDRIMQEVENLGPGTTRELRVELPAGHYQGACKPGMVGDGIRTDIAVSGQQAAPLSENQQLTAAAHSYSRYVQTQSRALIAQTREFVAAVRAGDVGGAKQMFPVARTPWERIEPVAEIFGTLDPAIDARVNDVAEGSQWTGYHRIEKQLWVAGNTRGMAPYADRLLADVQRVVALAERRPLTALQLAQGAKGLLDEVATGKVTGEEDRYSHTDLWDFAANVEGSKAAIAALRPVLADRDPGLLADIDARFAAVEHLLAEQRAGDGFVLYTDLSPAEVRQLSEAVAAVSESVSQVAAVVAGQ